MHLLLLAIFAQGVDTIPRNNETITLTITGSADIDGVYRSRTLVDARGSFSTTTGAEREASQVEAKVDLRLTASLLENVDLSLLLRNERLPGGGVLGANPEGLTTIVKEAWIRFNQFCDPGLSLSAGAQPFAFDVRGRGSAFFFDPYHAESFATDINTSFPVSMIDSLQPAGLVVRYTREEFEFAGAALTLIEGGSVKFDEVAYVGTMMGTFGRGSRWGVIAALDAVAGARTSTFTVGGGLSLREVAGWELYAEWYAQMGDRTEIIFGGQVDGLSGLAHAFQVGARYESQGGRSPDATDYFLEANITFLGNDHDITDDVEKRFLSYENVNDLLVIESSTYGLDLDTNLLEFKLLAGMSPWNRVRLSAAFGVARLTAGAPYIPTALGRTDDLGIEGDGRIIFELSKQVTLHAEGGVLMGSRLVKKVTSGSDDRAGVAVIGVTVRF